MTTFLQRGPEGHPQSPFEPRHRDRLRPGLTSQETHDDAVVNACCCGRGADAAVTDGLSKSDHEEPYDLGVRVIAGLVRPGSGGGGRCGQTVAPHAGTLCAAWRSPMTATRPVGGFFYGVQYHHPLAVTVRNGGHK